MALKKIKKYGLLMIVIMSSTITFAERKVMKQRTIHLSGLVVDAKTLNPISSVMFFDKNGNKLGLTNENGYYDIEVKQPASGQIKFELVLKKPGFTTFIQKEHWGDIKGDVRQTLYFGLDNQDEKASGFSSLSSKNQGSDYESVLKGFEDVKQSQIFDQQISDSKKNNNKVFFEINSTPYLVSNTGWIKLHSNTDLVDINGQKIVTANELNDLVKRSNIKRMTPAENTDRFSFHIEVK